MGKTVGNWSLGKQLGRGGQGHVFLAQRSDGGSDSEQFALKRLSRTTNRKARARFAREIEALKRIDHPCIVKPIDHSEVDDETPFYVMPFVEGVSELSKIIWRSGSDSPYKDKPEACFDFMVSCAEAIACAHEASVVHRDLKPDNLLVRDGVPLIIDFGCCVLLDDEGVLTLTDEGVGGRNFMAPECEAGIEGETSALSDVYSLGKILWCMLSGQRPFAREQPGFSNKLATTLMPDDPHAGFIVEAMLQSVRADPSHRAQTAERFADACRSFRDRIRGGGAHVSHCAVRCLACRGRNVRIDRGRTGGPMPFHADMIVGNPNNNPDLRAKFCTDCGTVTLHDTRPLSEYETRLKEAR